MPVDPGSYRHGPPEQGRHRKLKPTERPLKAPVDEWLARGGWDAGWSGAGSVALDDDAGARSRVHNLWATEKRARGWTAGDVASRIVTAPDGARRFYWYAPEPGGAEVAVTDDRVAPGVYRHRKGHLHQVLFPVVLAERSLGGGAVRFLFHAGDSTNGPREGRSLVVQARHWQGVHLEAYPTGYTGDVDPEPRPAVVYVGLTLDGEPTPGLRVRVRDAAEFAEPVTWPDGAVRPRFVFVGEEWSPDA